MKTDLVPPAEKMGKAVITLERLHFYARHGALPQEGTVGGHYTVDITLELNPQAIYAAIADDELAATVNYAEVYDIIRHEMEQPHRLLEHVCGRMLQAILKNFAMVARATVCVRKDNPPIPGIDAEGCSVTLSAGR